VTAVPQNLIVIQFNRARGVLINHCDAARYRRHDAQHVAVFERRRVLLGVADIFIVDVDIYKMTQRALSVVEVLFQVGIFAGQRIERLADGGGLDATESLPPRSCAAPSVSKCSLP